MAPPDPLSALVAFLSAVPAVADRVDGRVFGGELPRAENASMPREAIVLKPAGGGLLGTAYQDWGDKRVDVDCYGATPHEAHSLHLVVFAALKQLRRERCAGVLLHWARSSADGTAARDPKTDWPLTISSWQVLASEISVA